MTRFVTAPDGVRIAYEIAGPSSGESISGASIVLVHGFAASRVQNWRAPGWYDTLSNAGYRVIALDCRGHGESDKPHDPKMYGHDVMALDVIAVMDAAGLDRPFLMGYSMGGFIGMHVMMDHAERVQKLVIGGVGGSYLQPLAVDDAIADPARRNMIAEALLADDKNTIANPTARAFREFAEQDGKDRLALAACMRAERKAFTAVQLSRSTRPVLVVCGERDNLTGRPEPLAKAFANGRAVMVPKRDHMTTVGDKVYKAAVLKFLVE
ncbi:MAG: alpha/beta hydrolase [Proteobacteria bacterium]|nr:alpha/beta hydrolase [Pseudomonadota bacterium]